MEYTRKLVEVHTEHYTEHYRAQRGHPAGVEYITVAYRRYRSADGQIREDKMTWCGTEPGARHIVIGHDSYPASRSPLNLDEKTEDKPVKSWTDLTRGDFYTDGVQLDMLAGIEGDGCGTISLDEIAAEVQAAPVDEGRADGALFGLAVSEVPADGALFTVVAA